MPSSTSSPAPIQSVSLAGAPELAFFSVPEPGRLLIRAERPGSPPRVLADLAIPPEASRARTSAVVSPDGRWVAVTTSEPGGPGDVFLFSAGGETVWRAQAEFAVFVWAADSSVLAVDHIDGTGLLVELETGGTLDTLPITFGPEPEPEPEPDPSAGPVQRGLRQPIGFSVDGRSLYAYRIVTEPPHVEVGSRIDRGTGHATATTATGTGGDALARSNLSIQSPEGIGPDGTVAWIGTGPDGPEVRFRQPDGGSIEPIPLHATHAGDAAVWDGDRVTAITLTVGDPEAPLDEIDVRANIVSLDPISGAVLGSTPLAAPSFVPSLIGVRDGFALVRLISSSSIAHALVDVDAGRVSGFTSEGGFAGWITEP